MYRITAKNVWKNVFGRFDLILLASKKRAIGIYQQRALVETKDDKNTLLLLKKLRRVN